MRKVELGTIFTRLGDFHRGFEARGGPPLRKKGLQRMSRFCDNTETLATAM